MQKVSQPLVTIISINWNATQVTCEFLHSIRENNSYKNIEIIIVDNNSQEDPSNAFSAIISDIKILRNKTNLGFAGGNNIGISVAKGDFLFLVNNDTEFTPGLIEGLLEVFKTYADAGIVSPKFQYFYEKGTIEYAGYEAVNPFTGRNGMIGSKQKDSGQFSQVSVTNYAHGGAMMISRKVVQQVGMMPEEFFLYYEEFDWCEKIKKKGYKVYFQPNCLIYHKESMSTGKESPLKTFYHTRNRILFMRRNSSRINFILFCGYFILLTIPKNTFTFLFKGKIKHLKSFWKGTLWHFNNKISFN